MKIIMLKIFKIISLSLSLSLSLSYICLEKALLVIQFNEDNIAKDF